MAIELFSSPSGLLISVVNAVVPVFFLIGTFMFYRGYTNYGGNLKKIAFFLMCGGIAGTLASAFGWMGDFFSLWRWGESIFLFIFAIISIIVAYLVFFRLMEIAIIFGMIDGDE